MSAGRNALAVAGYLISLNAIFYTGVSVLAIDCRPIKISPLQFANRNENFLETFCAVACRLSIFYRGSRGFAYADRYFKN